MIEKIRNAISTLVLVTLGLYFIFEINALIM